MSIAYSLIARGSVILCSQQYTEGGNFNDVVRSMLPNIPTNRDTKTTYTSASYAFHVMVSNGLIFLCATQENVSKNHSYSFLQELKQQLTSVGLNSRAQFAGENELVEEFNPVLRSSMNKYSSESTSVNNSSQLDNINVLRSQVNEVKDVMSQNIEKVLERGENLEVLMNKTEDLQEHSASFQKTARKVHKKMWWKNTKWTLIIVGVALIVVIIIVFVILFSTGVLPPKPGPTTPPPVTHAP